MASGASEAPPASDARRRREDVQRLLSHIDQLTQEHISSVRELVQDFQLPVARPGRASSTTSSQSASRSVPASDSYVFDRLTNTALYTGTHRHRFDADGRGRGLAGRDSAPKGRGSRSVRSLAEEVLGIRHGQEPPRSSASVPLQSPTPLGSLPLHGASFLNLKMEIERRRRLLSPRDSPAPSGSQSARSRFEAMVSADHGGVSSGFRFGPDPEPESSAEERQRALRELRERRKSKEALTPRRQASDPLARLSREERFMMSLRDSHPPQQGGAAGGGGGGGGGSGHSPPRARPPMAMASAEELRIQSERVLRRREKSYTPRETYVPRGDIFERMVAEGRSYEPRPPAVAAAAAAQQQQQAVAQRSRSRSRSRGDARGHQRSRSVGASESELRAFDRAMAQRDLEALLHHQEAQAAAAAAAVGAGAGAGGDAGAEGPVLFDIRDPPPERKEGEPHASDVAADAAADAHERRRQERERERARGVAEHGRIASLRNKPAHLALADEEPEEAAAAAAAAAGAAAGRARGAALRQDLFDEPARRAQEEEEEDAAARAQRRHAGGDEEREAEREVSANGLGDEAAAAREESDLRQHTDQGDDGEAPAGAPEVIDAPEISVSRGGHDDERAAAAAAAAAAAVAPGEAAFDSAPHYAVAQAAAAAEEDADGDGDAAAAADGDGDGDGDGGPGAPAEDAPPPPPPPAWNEAAEASAADERAARAPSRAPELPPPAAATVAAAAARHEAAIAAKPGPAAPRARSAGVGAGAGAGAASGNRYSAPTASWQSKAAAGGGSPELAARKRAQSQVKRTDSRQSLPGAGANANANASANAASRPLSARPAIRRSASGSSYSSAGGASSVGGGSAAPASRPAASAASGSVVDRLTNPALFTGVQKKRFEEESKARAAAVAARRRAKTPTRTAGAPPPPQASAEGRPAPAAAAAASGAASRGGASPKSGPKAPGSIFDRLADPRNFTGVAKSPRYTSQAARGRNPNAAAAK